MTQLRSRSIQYQWLVSLWRLFCRDVQSKLGGPCAVTNIYLEAMLKTLGYDCYLVACSIAGKPDCHAAVIVNLVSILCLALKGVWFLPG